MERSELLATSHMGQFVNDVHVNRKQELQIRCAEKRMAVGRVGGSSNGSWNWCFHTHMDLMQTGVVDGSSEIPWSVGQAVPTGARERIKHEGPAWETSRKGKDQRYPRW